MQSTISGTVSQETDTHVADPNRARARKLVSFFPHTTISVQLHARAAHDTEKNVIDIAPFYYRVKLRGSVSTPRNFIVPDARTPSLCNGSWRNYDRKAPPEKWRQL